MKLKYLNLDLLSEKDKKQIESAGFVISSDNTIDENLYQSIILNQYIHIEINKMIEEYIQKELITLSNKEKEDMETKISVELTLNNFKENIEKYLRMDIEQALNKIKHEDKING